ncbi:cupin domain-containing protein [Ensifer sp. ENS06]|uniref:cupin domain-containing protein n=1 Tax=Ensifer sp. ENS06 TaxID=2769276 RepID=UPI00177F4B19|nr:cupin domain-containing protein [Ensifer sp. ENS06]MBD9626996.1 cupin domain-containing protein [Ensifer sp. ENS06]
MAEDEFDVGRRLKALRTAANLSQRLLADRAQVPHAQISIIEQNKSSPSISTLRKILGGLGVSMSDFFEEDQAGTSIGPFFGPEDLVDLTSRIGRNGSLSLRQVGDAKSHNLQILHEVYGPGADTGEAFLQHPSSEGGIVIQGEVEVTVGDQVRVLRAGESYLFDSRTPHRFRNRTSAVAIVISACSPPYL